MNEDYKRSNETFNAHKAIIEDEIEATELDEQEIKYCLWIGKSIKWRKSQNDNPSFRAKKDTLSEVGKKDLK